MKPGIISVLVHIYHYLLRLYPTDFLDEFGQEMEEVFASTVEEAIIQYRTKRGLL